MADSGAFRDVVLAIVIVGGVLGGLFLYTGVWPPMVVVESGSMMHGVACPAPAAQTGPDQICDPRVGYGKLGFIDPGDMVFVKKAEKRGDLTTMAEGLAKNQPSNYGKPGDVVVYFPFNQRQRTPIIHRAIAWVEATGISPSCTTNGPGPTASYEVFWDGSSHTFDASGIYLPSMGFGGANYNPNNGWKPCWSGFITKGDNPVTNTLPDQALGGSVLPNQPVELSWVEGKAVGELPWFGLIKLALSGQTNYQCAPAGVSIRANDPACENGKAVKVLNAIAPGDLWASLGISLVVIAVAPLAYDLYILRRRKPPGSEAEGGTGVGPARPGPLANLKEKLGLGPPPPPEEGAADPSRAFDAAAPAPSGGRSDGSPPGPSPPPGAGPQGAPTKFERVQKK